MAQILAFVKGYHLNHYWWYFLPQAQIVPKRPKMPPKWGNFSRRNPFSNWSENTFQFVSSPFESFIHKSKFSSKVPLLQVLKCAFAWIWTFCSLKHARPGKDKTRKYQINRVHTEPFEGPKSESFPPVDEHEEGRIRTQTRAWST